MSGRRASLSRLLLATCVLFLLALFALLGAATRWTYLGALDEAARSADDLTRTAESQLLRIMEQADLLLMEQRDIARTTDWTSARDAWAVNERLSQRTDVLPYVFRLFILDETGGILATSAPDVTRVDAADRDYFQAQRSADRGLYISTALRAKSTGQPIVVFSRRVSNAEGAFRGVVIVSFDLDALSAFFAKLPSKYDPRIHLIGADMNVLVATPPLSADESRVVHPLLQQKIREAPAGSVTYVSRDGVERIWTYRNLAPYSLIVRTGISKAAVVDEWWAQTRPYLAFAVVALFSLSALSLFAFHRARNEDRFRAALVDVNARLEERVRERTENLEAANRRLSSVVDELGEKSRTLETINRVNQSIAAEFDLDRLVQTVTDAGTEITGARFGAFFYNVHDEVGESYALYALSGVPRDSFARFPMPRNTAVFHPTFAGEGIVRSGDITRDPRYGRNSPFSGLPEGHLPVCSYLAVPVIARSGEVIGGLFFGHPEPDVFTERAEEIVAAIASQAAIAYDKAQLYRDAQQEIARRARTESALRESEARFRQLADSMPQIVWTARPDGWPDYYNGRWYEYTGLPAGTLARWHGILHEEDAGRVREDWLRSVRTGELCEIEYRLRGRDGAYRWQLGRALPVRDERGRIVHWFATSTDIDDLKRAEADLARAHDEQATQADRLRQALADREILFKEVHHRVKNNLQVICSLIRMQANRLEDPVGRSALDDTYNRIHSIGLVHEVLYGEQEAADLDVGAYLHRLCGTLAQVYGAAERGVAIDVSATGSLDLVRAVPLGLLVNELVSNALKHAFPAGRSGRIRLSFAAPAEGSDDGYELVVGDDGVGMPEAPVGSVQAGSAQPGRPQPGGIRSGSLGLTIIRALVQQLRATMTRRPGPGTVYEIRFPA